MEELIKEFEMSLKRVSKDPNILPFARDWLTKAFQRVREEENKRIIGFLEDMEMPESCDKPHCNHNLSLAIENIKKINSLSNKQDK